MLKVYTTILQKLSSLEMPICKKELIKLTNSAILRSPGGVLKTLVVQVIPIFLKKILNQQFKVKD